MVVLLFRVRTNIGWNTDRDSPMHPEICIYFVRTYAVFLLLFTSINSDVNISNSHINTSNSHINTSNSHINMSVNSHIQLNAAAPAPPEAPNFQAFNDANSMTGSTQIYTQHEQKVGQQLQLIANQTPNGILQNLVKAVQDGFARIDDRLDRVDDRLACMDDRLDGMDDRLAHLDAKYVALTSLYC
jgi:hypothetical protein